MSTRTFDLDQVVRTSVLGTGSLILTSTFSLKSSVFFTGFV